MPRIAPVSVAAVGACLVAWGHAWTGPPVDAPQVNRVTLVRLPDGGIQPQMATDATGAVHVIYFKGAELHGDLFYAQLDGAGHFSRPIAINDQPGSAVAAGHVRGAHLALGRSGRVHVAWFGSDHATATSNLTPMLYTRMNDSGQGFEPERNVRQFTRDSDGGSVAADGAGHVYVAWHGATLAGKGEADARVWIAQSTDEGRTFAPEVSPYRAATGACGCCGIGALADRQGALYVLYRSATDVVHRDTYLLTSRDHGASFTDDLLQAWNVGACPMSTFALADGRTGVLAAWETGGQVQWCRIDPRTGTTSAVKAAPGAATNRKYPAIAGNSAGETILVWVEDAGWNKGGALLWQVFDRDGRPSPEYGRAPGVPASSLVAVAARPDGGFTILY